MRLLALADTQLGSGRALADDRLADQEAVLDQIVELAYERRVRAVVHLGDVFEVRHPGEEERLVFKRFIAKITGGHYRGGVQDWFAKVIVLAGNHDLSNTARASAVDLYDRCEFVRIPTVLDLGGASLACLPWAPIHNLVAERESSERAGANMQAAEALIAIARDLRERCPAGKPALLAAHWAISGASLPNGLTSDQLGEVVIPQEALADFDTVIAGHLHTRGWFAKNALYTGSPYPNNFGEGNENGVWIWDSEDSLGDGRGGMEYVSIPSRPLVTIDCDLTAGDHRRELLGRLSPEAASLAAGTRFIDAASGETIHPSEFEPQVDETDRIAAAIAEHFPLTDATVRLRFACTEEQHSRVKIPKLRDLIMDAGAHRISQIEPTIVRADRARAVVDESFTPAAALDAWCEANGAGEQREALQGLLARFGGEA